MYGSDVVEKIIPHRAPLLLVDGVRDVRPGREITAVTGPGTFATAHGRLVATLGAEPDRLPAGLLIEAVLQTAALLTSWDEPNPDVLSGRVALVTGVGGVGLPRPVRPGETVEHRVELLRRIGDAVTLTGRSRVGDADVVVVRDLTMTARTATELRADRDAKGA